MRKMKTLIVNCPNTSDPTSFYRGIGPLSSMRRERPGKLNLAFLKDYNWSSLCLGDGLFLQRPYTGDHKTIIQMAKRQGLPVWVDYDDDLFSVPTDNPSYRIYGDDDTQKTIASCIALADVISVSTEALKEKLERLFKEILKRTSYDIRVVPNGLMTNIVREKPNFGPRNPLVFWRGSSTHHRDVMTVSKEIIKVHNEFKEYTWHFIGDRLWFLTDYMKHDETLVSDPLDTIEYFDHIRKISPKVIIVPLLESSFNRSKSNIAWIEGTYAGALTIAPKQLPEFDRPGVLRYESPEEFENILRQVLLGAFDNSPAVQQSWKYIEENLLIEKVNEGRWSIVEDHF